jgi:hypothetical protein
MEDRCQCSLKHAARQLILYGSLTDRFYSSHRTWLDHFRRALLFQMSFITGIKAQKGSLFLDSSVQQRQRGQITLHSSFTFNKYNVF